MNNKVRKVYVVGSQKDYACWINDYTLVDNITEADIVVFTGGEDVSPELYNEPNISSYCNLARDLQEKEEFRKIKKNQLVIGICRGSQFLCVMNGGKLVQDCSNHAIGGTHQILLKDYISPGNHLVAQITSTHHQMQYPYNIPSKGYKVLAIAEGRSHFYIGSGIDSAVITSKGEPEIVLYRRPNKPICLAIQGHPEYMDRNSPTISILNDLVTKYLKIAKNRK